MRSSGERPVGDEKAHQAISLEQVEAKLASCARPQSTWPCESWYLWSGLWLFHGVWVGELGSPSRQQCVQPAAHLLRGTGTLLVFPRTQLGLDQIACQHQMIVSNGHQVAPALKLLGGTHTRLVPQQRLFRKAIALFLAEAPPIARAIDTRSAC